MKQNLNSLGLRLKIIYNDHSFWFSKNGNLFLYLQKDYIIRNNIIKLIKKCIKEKNYEFIGIIYVEIKKNLYLFNILIYIGFNEFFIKKQIINIKEFKNILNNNKINFIIVKVSNPFKHPIIIAEYISLQILNKISISKIIIKIIELINKLDDIKGIKIKISEFNNKKKRINWIIEGNISLQIIHNKINFDYFKILNKNGILSINTWIFKN
uniref:ribosomal protein S3 n=1 Tax=Pogoniopsis schenckii TaxID=1582014 RepID=UPI00223747B9|nr:ribosomal protein S3 [Pogoniopsis schenckii]UYP51008.1 ribosomal protein S3 [Pogoniopsis schenckii]